MLFLEFIISLFLSTILVIIILIPIIILYWYFKIRKIVKKAKIEYKKMKEKQDGVEVKVF